MPPEHTLTTTSPPIHCLGALFLEFTPKKNQHLLTFLSIFFSFGAAATSLLGYFLLPPFSCETKVEGGCQGKGWRYMLLSLGGVVRILPGSITCFQHSFADCNPFRNAIKLLTSAKILHLLGYCLDTCYGCWTCYFVPVRRVAKIPVKSEPTSGGSHGTLQDLQNQP